MSKQVKDMLTRDLAERLEGVSDCVVANVVGLNANATVTLRRRLREKDIRVMVVKNSLARRATEGSSLAPAFEGLEGSSAVVWGGEDFISLVKEVAELDKSTEYEAFVARGGVMDGEALDADKVRQISKWPSRREQLSILSGQLTAAWTRLQSQLLAPGGLLASQIEKKSKEGES
jgi:ribosomal protein L10